MQSINKTPQVKMYFVAFFALLCCFSAFTQASGQKSFLGKSFRGSPELIEGIIDAGKSAHPYRNVNSLRPDSYWNLKDSIIAKGNSNDYQVGDLIGQGTFAKVFKGVHIPTGNKVALKYCFTPRADIYFRREIQILQELNGAPNFLPIRDIYEAEGGDNEHDTLVLVFDYFEAPRYRDLLKDLTKLQIKHFIYELLRTVDYAHSKGIIHRDLKYVNLLMNPDSLEMKVIDWGLADFYRPERKLGTLVSTQPYKSPEILLDYGFYDYSMDIWSTGCVLAGMVFQKNYFFGFDPQVEKEVGYPQMDPNTQPNLDKLKVIAKVLGTVDLVEYVEKHKQFMNIEMMKHIGMYERVPFTDFINDSNRHLVDSEVIDLLEKMLVIDHTERITASEALQHSYFDDVRI